MIVDRLSSRFVRRTLQDPAHRPAFAHQPAPAGRAALDDILGYHYYTELAHSAGMDQAPLGPRRGAARARAGDPRPSGPLSTTRRSMAGFWRSPARFLGFKGDRVAADDADCALRCGRAADGPAGLGGAGSANARNLEKVFLTNDFDDPLEGFDTNRYVPCLRTDDLVFHLDKPARAPAAGEGDRHRGRRRAAACGRGHRRAVRALHAQAEPRPARSRCRPTFRRRPVGDDRVDACHRGEVSHGEPTTAQTRGARRLLDARRILPRVSSCRSI